MILFHHIDVFTANKSSSLKDVIFEYFIFFKMSCTWIYYHHRWQ